MRASGPISDGGAGLVWSALVPPEPGRGCRRLPAFAHRRTGDGGFCGGAANRAAEGVGADLAPELGMVSDRRDLPRGLSSSPATLGGVVHSHHAFAHWDARRFASGPVHE